MVSWTRHATLAGALALAAVAPVGAAITTAPGWVAGTIPTPDFVQGGVVRAGDAVFVGQGAFGVGLQQVIRLDGGVATTIATGFNSLGGFAFAGGTLYVTDNGGHLMGATTGDTVYAVPDALTRATALPAAGAEVVPSGSIPFAQDVVVSGSDLIVSDGTGPGAGRVVKITGGVASNLVTGFDYTAGLALAGGNLLVGNVDATFTGSVAAYTLAGTPVGPVVGGLSGCYAIDLDNDGNLLVSGGFKPDFSSSTILAVAPGGAQSERASGFVFSSELFHDPARNETLVLDVGVSEIATICRDADADGACDADQPCIGGVALTRAKLTLTKVALPTGDDGLKLTGEMIVPTSPALDPLMNGVRLAVTGAAGTVADVALPGGAYDAGTKTGWKVKGGGTAWTFSSKAGVAGITKVAVKKLPVPAGRVKVKVTGKKGAFVAGAGDLPLRATFSLDAAGQCGTSAFASCALAGPNVRCK
ncbi:MAG: hypothetical protein KIT14_23270 [bacterium]|nr:hypothetical protein [bacterium]